MTEPTRCGCPPPYNTIARAGACDTCGVRGPDRDQAVREKLASGRQGLQLARDLGREQGRRTGYQTGVQEGRRQAEQALLKRELAMRPFARISERSAEREMEAG